MRKFVGIGVGPGDPDLLTVRAVKELEKADVIICPIAREGSESVAYKIAEPHIQGGEILRMVFPMTHDKDVLKKAWDENAKEIKSLLDNGKYVVFMTLGDPAVYSTYMYMVDILQHMDIEVVTIPGIPSFVNIANSINVPLMMGDEALTVVPMMKDGKAVEKALDDFENVVIMKPSHNRDLLVKFIEERKLQDRFVLVTSSGTDKEKTITDIEELRNYTIPYLSTMIVKKGGF